MPVTPGDRSSAYAHQVIRMLRVVRGEIPFRLLCAPRFNYARVGHTVRQEGDSLCFRPECEDCPSMSLHASVPLRIDGVDGRAEFSLASGQSAVFAFGNVPDAEKPLSIYLINKGSNTNLPRPPSFGARGSHSRSTPDAGAKW